MKTKKGIMRAACKGKGGVADDVKNIGWDAMDKVERGNLKNYEIPMRYQPDFVKDAHFKNFGKNVGGLIGGVDPIEKMRIARDAARNAIPTPISTLPKRPAPQPTQAPALLKKKLIAKPIPGRTLGEKGFEIIR